MENAERANGRKQGNKNSLNLVFLLGNLTRDPVLRRTNSGVAVADLGIAVSDGWRSRNGEKEESVCFLDVITWDKQAEACAAYLQKGSSVFIEGRLQLDEWKDKDTGAKRNKVKVRAERVQFLSRPAPRSSSEPGSDVEDDPDAPPPPKSRR